MDGQDHNMTASSTGHEVHGVHLCHRCGWPFPNPHPSAKHRRAHKRHCGTIEGYKVIHSEEPDHHLVGSDDDQASDEDEHTPSPKPVKKNVEFGSSGGVGEMSNRSEDDVFTDAVTEFSDSGISPQLERLESATGLNKGTEQKRSENDSPGMESLKVNETADKIERYDEATKSKEVINPGTPVVTANDQSGFVAPLTDSRAEAVSIELENNLQDDVIKSEISRDVVEDNVKKCVDEDIQHEQNKAGHDSDKLREETKPASVYADSNEGIISDPSLIAVENKEELHDKLVPETAKHNLLHQTETFQNKDDSAEVKSADVSTEISCYSGAAGEIALAKEAHENTSVPTGVEKVSASIDDVGSVGAGDILHEENLLIRPSAGAVYGDAFEPSNDAFSAKEESKQKSSSPEVEPPANDVSEGEKLESDGHENGNGKYEDNHLIETVSAPASADGTFAAGDDQAAKVVKGDESYCEEKPDVKSLADVTAKGGGDPVEVKGTVDPTRDLSTDIPSLTEADSSGRNVEGLPKSKFDAVESNLEKSVQGQSSDRLNEELHSVSSVGLDAGLNHNVSVLDKQSSTATSEYPVPQVILESPNNIHVPNHVELESAPAAETVEERTREIVASESTPEQRVTKESTFPELLKENLVKKEDECVETGVRALDNPELNHDNNIAVHAGISESPKQTQQENLSAEKSSNEISPDVEERHVSEDISTANPYGIVLNAEQTLDSNIATSEKCSVTSSLNQAVPSSLHFQELHETSAPTDDKNVINAEPTYPDHSKSLQDKDEKASKLRDVVTAVDQPDNSSVKSDILDGNCAVGSVSFESNTAVAGTDSPSPDSLTANSQQDKTTTKEAYPDKSDDFEPPSFMTLVQTDDKYNHVSTASEIETVQNNGQPKPEALQAGWFPSLTNVVNESEGRKKNEEIIAKVTNSSPVKYHSPLKSLLHEAKSPTTKQVPAPNPKFEAEPVNNGAGVTTLTSSAGPEAPAQNDHDAHKDIDEWNSPARYPIEPKKEKKKGKSIWVPFMCCSSVHKDL